MYFKSIKISSSSSLSKPSVPAAIAHFLMRLPERDTVPSFRSLAKSLQLLTLTLLISSVKCIVVTRSLPLGLRYPLLEKPELGLDQLESRESAVCSTQIQ